MAGANDRPMRKLDLEIVVALTDRASQQRVGGGCERRVTRRLPMKLKFFPVGMMWSIESFFSQPSCSAQEKSTRVTIIAEKTEAMTPTTSVTAKPCTGPEPRK